MPPLGGMVCSPPTVQHWLGSPDEGVIGTASRGGSGCICLIDGGRITIAAPAPDRLVEAEDAPVLQLCGYSSVEPLKSSICAHGGPAFGAKGIMIGAVLLPHVNTSAHRCGDACEGPSCSLPNGRHWAST